MEDLEMLSEFMKTWQSDSVWVEGSKRDRLNAHDHNVDLRVYGSFLRYDYVEYTGKKHRRIKKRLLSFANGDIIHRRFAALTYMQNRREVLLSTGMKFYQQVWMVNRLIDEKIIISGDSLLYTLYGLAKESQILFFADLERVESPYLVSDDIHYRRRNTGI